MQRELHDAAGAALRRHDDVRCVVLTGAGEKAFCTGIDRMEQMGGEADDTDRRRRRRLAAATPFMFNDPGDNIGPKSCDLWKPVIAAVNGMACGGAFYMLGEVEFIIAAEHATFFDPHVTYGMTAAFEPIHMAGITPFGEIMRLSLLGNYERMSAQRAPTRSAWCPRSCPATSSSTRAAWCADAHRRRSRSSRSRARCARSGAHASSAAAQAVRLGYAYVAHGHQPGLDRRRPEDVRVRQAHRVEAALSDPTAATTASRDRRRRAVRLRARRHQDRRSSCTTRPRRAHRRRRAHQGRHRRLRLERHRACSRRSRSPSTSGCARRGSTAPASAAATWEFMVEHATAAILAGHAETVVLVYGSTTRADLKARRRTRQPRRSAAAARSSSTCRSGTR